MLPFVTFLTTCVTLLIVLFAEKVIYRCDLKDPYLPPLVSYILVFLPYMGGIFWSFYNGASEVPLYLLLWALMCFVISYIGLSNIARHCR